MQACNAPVSDERLLDYWAGDSTADEVDRIEAHLFACGDCSARLDRLAAIGAGLNTLVREGRISGILSRALVNRMQRDGVRLRLYALSPGEMVPCAAFPDDDLVVAALRADFSGVHGVTLSVLGPGKTPFGEFDEIPVVPSEHEVFWALPGAVVRQLPSTRLQITLTSTGEGRAVLGEYVLDHSAPESTAG